MWFRKFETLSSVVESQLINILGLQEISGAQVLRAREPDFIYCKCKIAGWWDFNGTRYMVYDDVYSPDLQSAIKVLSVFLFHS